jgi:hypothetical protein
MALFGHTANNSFQDGFKRRSRPTECGMIFTNFELSSNIHIGVTEVRLCIMPLSPGCEKYAHEIFMDKESLLIATVFIPNP